MRSTGAGTEAGKRMHIFMMSVQQHEEVFVAEFSSALIGFVQPWPERNIPRQRSDRRATRLRSSLCRRDSATAHPLRCAFDRTP
jgi:hypothetical protein